MLYRNHIGRVTKVIMWIKCLFFVWVFRSFCSAKQLHNGIVNDWGLHKISAHRSLSLWVRKARERISEGLELLLDAESTWASFQSSCLRGAGRTPVTREDTESIQCTCTDFLYQVECPCYRSYALNCKPVLMYLHKWFPVLSSVLESLQDAIF